MNGRGTGAERVGGAQAIGRRGFLVGSGAAAAGHGVLGGRRRHQPSTTTPSSPSTTLHTARLAGDPFTLGVASGDPAPGSVILWTRLAPEPLAADGAGGMPDDVDVRWEVATDDRFTAVVGAPASPPPTREHGHSRPRRRRRARPRRPTTTTGSPSATGPARSAAPAPCPRPARRPTASPSPWPTASGYETGPLRRLPPPGSTRTSTSSSTSATTSTSTRGTGAAAVAPASRDRHLADYRLRYASYKVDPDLQAAHARFPFVCTWDDHEVANNYMGDTVPEGDRSPTRSWSCKAAAYRAWWENLPVRLDPPDGDRPRRATATSPSATWPGSYVLDERQDADVAALPGHGWPPSTTATAPSAPRATGPASAPTRRPGSRIARPRARPPGTWSATRWCWPASTPAPATRPSTTSTRGTASPTPGTRFIDAAGRGRQPRGAHRRLPRRHGPRRPTATLRARTAELVAPEFMAPPISSVLFPPTTSRPHPAAPPADQRPRLPDRHGRARAADRHASGCSTTSTTPTAPSRTAATWEVDAGDPTPRQA